MPVMRTVARIELPSTRAAIICERFDVVSRFMVLDMLERSGNAKHCKEITQRRGRGIAEAEVHYGLQRPKSPREAGWRHHQHGRRLGGRRVVSGLPAQVEAAASAEGRCRLATNPKTRRTKII